MWLDWEARNTGTYRSWTGVPLGERSLERCRKKWKHNIKMDISKAGCEFINCLH